MHLDEIVAWIDQAFGGDALDYVAAANDEPVAARQLIAEDSFQRYLRDEINRQVIRDYLTNAVVLGVICEDGLAAFADSVGTEEGRATLALYMLMSSVEDAPDLPHVHGAGELTPLQPAEPLASEPGDRSHIKLVP